MVLQALWRSFWLLWGALGGSLGLLDRRKRASRFVLELSWASFARFLLPKMTLGAFWGCLWLVLGAPESLLRVVLPSVKPISTIKTALPSFDTLFFLVVVVVAAAVVVAVVVDVVVIVTVVIVVVLVVGVVVVVVVVVVFVVSVVFVIVVVVATLLPCNFSSTRLGGMRGAIE